MLKHKLKIKTLLCFISIISVFIILIPSITNADIPFLGELQEDGTVEAGKAYTEDLDLTAEGTGYTIGTITQKGSCCKILGEQ